MDITPTVAAGQSLIDGYGPGLFRIRGQAWRTSVLVFPEAVSTWNAAAYADLTPQHLDDVFFHKPEVLLLGTGATFPHLPPKALREACREAGIVLEAMDSGAACRTFNILLSEGRRVAAALLLIEG